MTVKELTEKVGFKVVNIAEGAEHTEIKKIFCCDLLSIAMAKMPEGAAWVTVMSNLNTLAVAALSEVACVVIAEDIPIEDSVINKSGAQNITILATDLPVYEAARKIEEIAL